ncbi:MAG: hypothetical protein A3J47_03465 [Candidatus Yanofskybacteria bacterium RIFCSPHIGHO2_02_FULL_43_22]|uniref:Uncharacterized protein n=1 Tax=Candidatus Yanofskybacteria bacterium RIFCSPHIGHO2_02_FULL_43_22 TaxID=1802681 RepID=A0A1F8FN08_9BACT|nr:MAG: hypothetical protein A3J47_03465 [Candidatus Yanofskybacteria bacterium RIFCSPHIGHO2_02_FULL_43_22]
MRTSIVALSGDDLINLNETAYDMLRAILNGLNYLGTEWHLRFAFVEERNNMFSAYGEYLEEKGEDLTRITHMERFVFSFRAPDGLGAYKSLELLRSEVAKLCVAMTQGKVADDWGGLSQRLRGSRGPNEMSMMFFKRESPTTLFTATTMAAK